MQISSGIAKGHQLKVPSVPDLRPTKNMVRQAIFNILGEVKGLTVLDLFAGTGSLGIEALSRGAVWTDFVDISRAACEAIQHNLKHSRLKGKAKIYQESAEVFLISCPPRRFELIFADPPYEMNIDHILVNLVEKLKDGGVIVYLHPADKQFIQIKGLNTRETRRYGSTGVTFLTKEGG